jgi:glycosyltransferase involved in cell wall biosynthesis
VTKVLVLLSTWNGRRYLPAQIESLLAQQFEGELKILIRDDGSSDGTVEYLVGISDNKIKLIQGKNLGARGSFFELLQAARNEDADFVALCDQDDVWHPRKIERALSFLQGDGPRLYASSVNLVDENLDHIKHYIHPFRRTFAATLVCNFLTRCTCVFNRAFLDWMPFPEDTEQVLMHDWWLASISMLGRNVTYDEESFISYRQHSSNHVGIKTGIVSLLSKFRKALFDSPAVTRFEHVRQFLIAAGDQFSEEQRQMAIDFLRGQTSILHRIRFVITYRDDVRIQSAIRLVLFG